MTRRQYQFVIGACLVASVAVIVGLFVFFHRESAAKLAALYGGPENLDVVKSATDVRAYRLRNEASAASLDKPPAIPRANPAVSDSVSLTSEQSRRLSGLLADFRSYAWDSAVGCVPTPGVKFAFHDRGRVVSVSICFNCSMIFIDRDGKSVGVEECHQINRELLHLARELFPDDEQLKNFNGPLSAGYL